VSVRTSSRRIYMRKTAFDMREQGKSLKQIADFLEIKKEQVSTLLKEYERCKKDV
jgi:hypothetical protein